MAKIILKHFCIANVKYEIFNKYRIKKEILDEILSKKKTYISLCLEYFFENISMSAWQYKEGKLCIVEIRKNGDTICRISI